jgi:hypothetical protein
MFDVGRSMFIGFFVIKLSAFQASGNPETCELQTGKKRRLACASFRCLY